MVSPSLLMLISRWPFWKRLASLLLIGCFWCGPASTGSTAVYFQLPTENQAIFEKNGMDRYFVPTVGRTWESGTFGSVRSDGLRFHEGIDIRPTKRDRNGEPLDSIFAVADGTVAYVSRKPGLSNYGKYIIIQHGCDGMHIYSLYAHLSDIPPDMTVGKRVRSGQVIGTMGRTTNTRDPITKDRAHLHFELNLFLNERFVPWFKKTYPGERNDHSIWNGMNLVGLDPRYVFLNQQSRPTVFSLSDFIRNQPVFCRVWIRKNRLPFANRYRNLLQTNPLSTAEGVAGYEIALNYYGLPVEIIPRAASETRRLGKIALLSVNAEEYKKSLSRRLVAQKNGRWELAENGRKLLELLTY